MSSQSDVEEILATLYSSLEILGDGLTLEKYGIGDPVDLEVMSRLLLNPKDPLDCLSYSYLVKDVERLSAPFLARSILNEAQHHVNDLGQLSNGYLQSITAETLNMTTIRQHFFDDLDDEFEKLPECDKFQAFDTLLRRVLKATIEYD